MDSMLQITLVFIVIATLIATFVRRIKRDKCLRDFSRFLVNLDRVDDKRIFGKLRVENTGIEFLYQTVYEDKDGHDESSYILYKHEFSKIQTLLRFHDELDEQDRKKRQKDLQKTYHPNFLRRLRRKTANLFKTLRDSVAEVVNLLISRVKKTTGFGATINSQDKYVTQMKQELIGSAGTSYEPLLERYIGHKVVLEMVKGETVTEYCGVLKEYTADFIELMDVDYKDVQQELPKKADIIVPRQYGLVRHLGE
ncbi:MAG: hypothetical protein JW804_07635 [Sedimentisphaerales bacterium]|nr:hypothetical protein [Sedimentisphaerales bacterium]